ncbi:hypothetical protein D3C78_941980 [compost metagenome]
MLARRPDIQFWLQQQEGHWQAVPADRLRQGNEIRLDPRTFEGEEIACPAAADLNLVGNEQDIVPAAKLLQPAQPLRVDDVNSAFGLYRFKQDGGRLVDSRVRISQDILDIAERIHFCESPARVRHERNSAQRKPRPFPHGLGACRRQAAERHAVEAAHECEYPSSLLRLACELQGRFHRVRPRRPAELKLVIQLLRLQDPLREALDEFALGHCIHIQTVHNPVGGQVIENPVLDIIVIMTVIQCPGTCKKINICSSVLRI